MEKTWRIDSGTTWRKEAVMKIDVFTQKKEPYHESALTRRLRDLLVEEYREWKPNESSQKALHTSCVVCVIIKNIHIWVRDTIMRTNVVLYDNLIDTALKLTGFRTKKKAIEEGLKLLIQVNKQRKIKQYRGKLSWTGDLDDMRSDTWSSQHSALKPTCP